MKIGPVPSTTTTPVTMQIVLERLAASGLSPRRKHDLRSAVTTFAKLIDRPAAQIPLDLALIRRSLDAMVPARAKVSRKRWANLRSGPGRRNQGVRPAADAEDSRAGR